MARAHSACTANPSAGNTHRPNSEKIWSRLTVVESPEPCTPRSRSTSNACPTTSSQPDNGASTARVNPSVSVGAPTGVHVAASAVIERRSLAGLSSKYCDLNRPPRNQRSANEPTRVPTGRAVRTNALGIPAALLLITMAFWMPGPHHSFSVERPATTGPRSAASVDWPGSTFQKPRSPNRSGRSIE